MQDLDEERQTIMEKQISVMLETFELLDPPEDLSSEPADDVPSPGESGAASDK